MKTDIKSNNKPKILLVGFGDEFHSAASALPCDFERTDAEPQSKVNGNGYYAIAICESGCSIPNIQLNAKYVLCPNNATCKCEIRCGNIISCGMDSRSTFGLSSFMNESGMFSVNRVITEKDLDNIPCEMPFKPIPTLSAYENIIINGIGYLTGSC